MFIEISSGNFKSVKVSENDFIDEILNKTNSTGIHILGYTLDAVNNVY